MGPLTEKTLRAAFTLFVLVFVFVLFDIVSKVSIVIIVNVVSYVSGVSDVSSVFKVNIVPFLCVFLHEIFYTPPGVIGMNERMQQDDACS